jgi:anti-sigma-K factor RskA
VADLHLAVPLVEPPADLKQKILLEVQPNPTSKEPFPAKSAWQRLWPSKLTPAPIWAYASLLLFVLLAASNIWLLERINRIERTAPKEFRTVMLAGTDFALHGSGLLVLSQDGNQGTLVVNGLPILDETFQYQLWLIKDEVRTNGGVFSVSQDGYGAMVISSDQPLAVFSAFGVTIEPAGGSPKPTGEKVLGGSL